MTVYTRHEHGNLPVRVRRDEQGQTVYEMKVATDTSSSGWASKVFTSARQLLAALYGHDVHMPFDRYFRIGKYRQAGRASGAVNLLTLLDEKQTTRRTDVVVHSARTRATKSTSIVVSQVSSDLPSNTEAEVVEVKGVVQTSLDPAVEEFVSAMREDLRPLEEFLPASPELVEGFEKAFALELDRLEGLVGISLGEISTRTGSKTRADEVRRLLWRGFAGKMLSQGYDPEDVLQEVYRGLLVRNDGRCPWDARKSTFGHYVHMVISCVLTNYHRKQARRIDRDSLPLVGLSKEGEEIEFGWGAVEIHDGCELGDMLALEGLAKHLARTYCGDPEAELGRQILPLVASGHQRAEIVRVTGAKPSMVSRALAWLRAQAAAWASKGGLNGHVPAKYRVVAIS
jgi:DNA-directed RNA polymerase specialized sigma24 family protein